MGRYNRDFGGIFTTGSLQWVFCDVIQAEAQKWIQRHERAKEELLLVDKQKGCRLARHPRGFCLVVP